MKRRIVGSTLYDSRTGQMKSDVKQRLDDALQFCMNNPSQKKLYAKMMNMPAEKVTAYLEGVLHTASLAHMDVAGLLHIYNLMLEHGVNDVRRAILNKV